VFHIRKVLKKGSIFSFLNWNYFPKISAPFGVGLDQPTNGVKINFQIRKIIFIAQ
jgi:hypothetical protein